MTLEDSLANQPEFIRYQNPCDTQPNDVEGLLNALNRLKRQNQALMEERTLLKVNADKYERRALYVRKKYQQLLEQTNENAAQVPADKNLRL